MNAWAPTGAMLSRTGLASRARRHRDDVGTAASFGDAGVRLTVCTRSVSGCAFAAIGGTGRS